VDQRISLNSNREVEETGEKEVIRNSPLAESFDVAGLKLNHINRTIAKNIMTLAMNLLDQKTLDKIQSLFLSLTADELKRLKNYLDYKKYKDRSFIGTPEHKIIKEISKIVLFTRTEDKHLKGLMDEYKGNLIIIDELKARTTQTNSPKKLKRLFNAIDSINKRNQELIEEVGNYNKRRSNS
jgi:hypothetical protein